ncbi:MAG: hypothetical protein JOS17DRAFT_264245 [Linnemannia elongata]|nr:MAG: hypothetical protein JOS17DRAFT_264245 [Linnemannia elongata]
MKSVRQKWASHKTYRRIQRTWQEYIGVDKSDVQSVAQKLNVFLDTFDEAYREVVPQAELEQTEMSIERIYGDCSEVMMTLFNSIEREFCLKKADRANCMQEPLNKALVLISLILKVRKSIDVKSQRHPTLFLGCWHCWRNLEPQRARFYYSASLQPLARVTATRLKLPN